MKEIKTVGVIGLGALGTMYAGVFTAALGKENVLILADSARTARLKQDGMWLNGEKCDFNYVDAAEVTEPVDLLIFAVKFTGLAAAMETCRHLVGPETTLMSVLNGVSSEELLAACRRYFDATGRRIHFEYAMIDGVNDGEVHARELLRRLKGLPAHFNLIPLNHVEESPLKPSSRNAVARFQKTLEDAGITATVRRTLGGDIDASCGQLRRNYTKEQNAPSNDR